MVCKGENVKERKRRSGVRRRGINSHFFFIFFIPLLFNFMPIIMNLLN